MSTHRKLTQAAPWIELRAGERDWLAAILAVGAAIESPVVADGRVEVARTMMFTLSVDRRAVDGVVAAEWMREFVAVVEHPLRLLI
jgi:pyruvate dehydrogenase E2 component (dihydrolipoamide acetyltransferase)